jgi:23S rRNA maturation mini-RNase III
LATKPYLLFPLPKSSSYRQPRWLILAMPFTSFIFALASTYHEQVVDCVRAESQANQLRSLEAHLTENERAILRRGRNAATRCPQRLSLKIYQQATSLETLIGYLYLKNPQRLQQLLEKLDIEPT